jgi:hypothetical protein
MQHNFIRKNEEVGLATTLDGICALIALKFCRAQCKSRRFATETRLRLGVEVEQAISGSVVVNNPPSPCATVGAAVTVAVSRSHIEIGHLPLFGGS